MSAFLTTGKADKILSFDSMKILFKTTGGSDIVLSFMLYNTTDSPCCHTRHENKTRVSDNRIDNGQQMSKGHKAQQRAGNNKKNREKPVLLRFFREPAAAQGPYGS